MKFKKFLVITLTLMVSASSLYAAPQTDKANQKIAQNADFKPAQPTKPDTSTGQGQITEIDATVKIQQMMPRGSSHVKTEVQTLEGKTYYKVVYTYRTMEIHGFVDAKTGSVTKIEAKDITQVDLKAKNVFQNNPSYRPFITTNEAETKAKSLLKDSKVIESAILGEYKLLWAYRTVVANNEMMLEVILDTETNAVRAVNAYPIINKDVLITEEKVREIIKQQVPKGTIISLELDQITAVYKVAVIDPEHSFTFKIDAKTGKIIEHTKVPLEANKILTEAEVTSIIKNNPQFKKVAITSVTLNKAKTEYEVKGTDGKFEYTIDVNAKTGKILNVDKVKIKDEVEADKFLTEKEIIDIIKSQAQYKKVNITDIELDEDDAVYEVEGTDGKFEYDFEVDAKSGKILDVEKDKMDNDHDDDDDENDEKEDD